MINQTQAQVIIAELLRTMRDLVGAVDTSKIGSAHEDQLDDVYGCLEEAVRILRRLKDD